MGCKIRKMIDVGTLINFENKLKTYLIVVVKSMENMRKNIVGGLTVFFEDSRWGAPPPRPSARGAPPPWIPRSMASLRHSIGIARRMAQLRPRMG